ncbi:MAG TPA: hypothetical protein VJ873_06300 [bacterium]|nr:hypothetical protein [bacterium]
MKTGAGLFLTQFHYTNYEDRPVINGVATEIMTWTGVSGFTGSLAGGIDFPDHFSIFLSGDWMAEDFSLMANAQYAFSNWGWAEPYVYFGLGMDYVKQATFGPAGQVGIGMDFPMTRDFTVYAETKAYIALGEWTDYLNEQLTYSWANFYVPVLIGTKLKL